MGKRIAACMLVFFFSWVSVFPEAGAKRRIVIGSAGENMPPTIVASAILAEAYERAGFSAEFAAFPPNRMIASLTAGTIDAIVLAEASLERESPGLIRIDIPIWTDELVAFSEKQLRIRAWKDLRGHRVGFLTAMLIIEQNIPGGAERFPAQGIVQLFRMLDTDRTDVVVTSRTIGKLMIGRLGLVDVRESGDTLAIVTNYHFLSRGNEDVAARVSAALAEMKRSGRMAEVTRMTLERLFGGAGE